MYMFINILFVYVYVWIQAAAFQTFDLNIELCFNELKRANRETIYHLSTEGAFVQMHVF